MIVSIIESAKGNGSKLNMLCDYFSPRGEFDKWIDQTSKGALAGPLKKETDKLKWLNELKRTHTHSALKKMKK